MDLLSLEGLLSSCYTTAQHLDGSSFRFSALMLVSCGRCEITCVLQPSVPLTPRPRCCVQVQQLQGVYSLQEPHFWTLCSDVYIGTVKLLVAPDADSRWILSQTHHIFTQVPERLTLVHPAWDLRWLTSDLCRLGSVSSMFRWKQLPCRSCGLKVVDQVSVMVGDLAGPPSLPQWGRRGTNPHLPHSPV